MLSSLLRTPQFELYLARRSAAYSSLAHITVMGCAMVAGNPKTFADYSWERRFARKGAFPDCLRAGTWVNCW